MGDIAQRDHRSVVDADRQVEDVVDRLKQAGHLDRKTPRARIQRTGRDQPVAPVDEGQKIALVDAITFEQQRIDDDFAQLVAVARNLRLQHAGNRLDLVAQRPRRAEQGAFRQLARQGHDQHRKQSDVHLVDGRLVRVVGKFDLGVVDPFAHIDQGLLDVDVRVELEQHPGEALLGRGADFVEPLDRAEFLFEGAHQEALRVLR